MPFKEKVISILPIKYITISKDYPLDYCLPVYHTVSDRDLSHLKHIIRYKNKKQFLADLDVLSKNFQWVTWDEFKDFVQGKFKAKKKVALLTFDDGLRDFKEVVAPILYEKGIFAINYINPQFVDNHDLSFRCKASLLVDVLLKSKTIHPEIFNLLGFKQENPKKIAAKILSISYANQSVLDGLAPLVNVNFSEFLKQEKPYLSFAEIQDLSKLGFQFGAHSWDHPLYGELNLEEQLWQSQNCFEYLKTEGLHTESFAFPFTDFGVEKVFFDALFSREPDLFCTFGAAGIKLDSIERNFHRIPMENGKGAEEILKEEIAYFRVKKLFGKNTIFRR